MTGTSTTHLGMYEPLAGEVGWASLVDGNFTTIDAAIAPFTSTLYVRPTGSNTNDGTSWAKPKKDILGAYDALPSTGGIILFETGAYVDATNTDRGLWLAGALDSNYGGALPTGWRQQKAGTLLIKGIPTIHVGGSRRPIAILGGGSATDTAKPLFWFSGCDQSVELRNIAARTELARPMELGADSGTGLQTNNSGFVFDNLWLSADTGDASHGPCINATSAYWVYGRDLTLYGNGHAAKTSDLRACYLLGGSSGSFHDLVWIRDSNFNAGGGVIQKATGSGTNIILDNIVQEPPSSGAYAGISGPIFWLHARMSFGNTGGAAQIMGCEQADQGAGSDKMVKVDAGNSPSFVVLHGSASVDGPATILGGAPQPTANTSPGSNRAVGFAGEKVIGQHDGHRRSFGPTAVKFANLANQDVTAWSGLTGSATVTTGKTAPDGSTNAARFSSASQQSKRWVSTSRTVAVGDWVLAGVWARAASGVWPAAMPEVDWSASDDLFDASDAGVSFFTLNAPWSASTKEWVWLSAAYKVTQASTTPSTLIFFGFSDATASMDYFAPVCLHIASGTFDDAEVLETYRHLGTWSNTASAGQLAMMFDQTLHIPRGYIEIGNMTPPGAPADNYARLYADTSGGKDRIVVRFATGAVQVIATEP